jgi:hypothetical protein
MGALLDPGGDIGADEGPEKCNQRQWRFLYPPIYEVVVGAVVVEAW